MFSPFLKRSCVAGINVLIASVGSIVMDIQSLLAVTPSVTNLTLFTSTALEF